MDYGLQISASGALASMHQQDALTNNLANINTTGFKPVLTGTMFRQAARQEDNLYQLSSDAMLERLGGGVLSAPEVINFAQGALESSKSEFDMAIDGDGFFVVGDAGSPQLTRDGRFTLDSENRLVMSTTGVPVLSESNAEIFIDPLQGPIEVSSEGVIFQGGAPINQIGIADVPDRSVLINAGGGRFASRNNAPLNLGQADGSVRQYKLESSSSSEIQALMKIQSASRSAQSNIGMIDLQNRLMQRAINTFGRFS